jgi:flagellar hook-associated protein 3 FlgL
MRIANGTMIYSYLRSLSKNEQRMKTYQEQLADGKIIHRPSDDPVRAIRSLRFNTDLFTTDQFTTNAKDGTQWLKQTDSTLTNLSEISQSAKTLVIQSVAANPTVSFQALGQKLDGLINQAVSLANTQIGDRYIFAGQQDKITGGPFERKIINGTEYVVYKGDNNKISMPIQPGTADPHKDSVNVTGGEVFGPLVTVQDATTLETYQVATYFSDLITIKDELMKTTPDVNFLSGAALTNIDNGQERMLLAQTEIGARMASYDMAQTMLENDYATIAEIASANDDIDLAQITIDFKNSQNVYDAALALGARILPKSLVDFLS